MPDLAQVAALLILAALAWLLGVSGAQPLMSTHPPPVPRLSSSEAASPA